MKITDKHIKSFIILGLLLISAPAIASDTNTFTPTSGITGDLPILSTETNTTEATKIKLESINQDIENMQNQLKNMGKADVVTSDATNEDEIPLEANSTTKNKFNQLNTDSSIFNNIVFILIAIFGLQSTVFSIFFVKTRAPAGGVPLKAASRNMARIKITPAARASMKCTRTNKTPKKK